MQGGNTHVAHTRPWPKQFESKQGNVEEFPASRHTCLQITSFLDDISNGCHTQSFVQGKELQKAASSFDLKVLPQ